MDILDDEKDRDYGRNVAVISYLWIVGWIIALVMNSQRRTELGSFHLRQALGLILLTIIIFWIVKIKFFLYLIYLAGVIYGVVRALNYQKEPLPGIGGLFQDWFKAL
ncbi:MAG: hypothetical protein IT223_03390 [Crocinitomicaceae bacterium]|nr:hypothetical protein [Crocinitomicaceae bacterium]